MPCFKMISKTCKKKNGKLRTNRQNSENTIFALWEVYNLRTKFEEFTLIYKATIAKIEFDLL